ncbi:MAG: methyltransferase domain-containing protein, partial [Chloroflexi bacterium]|nr:methyltransferase domain-containing protein [Chloroflexota bacterium]
MKIDYRETTSDLLKRIDIHNKFGGRDIDKWMLDIIKLKKGDKILDVGCGAGKQCFSYFNYLEGDASITGGDISDELLSQARSENKKINDAITFMTLNFNRPF